MAAPAVEGGEVISSREGCPLRRGAFFRSSFSGFGVRGWFGGLEVKGGHGGSIDAVAFANPTEVEIEPEEEKTEFDEAVITQASIVVRKVARQTQEPGAPLQARLEAGFTGDAPSIGQTLLHPQVPV